MTMIQRGIPNFYPEQIVGAVIIVLHLARRNTDLWTETCIAEREVTAPDALVELGYRRSLGGCVLRCDDSIFMT